jgi:septum formation protein
MFILGSSSNSRLEILKKLKFFPEIQESPEINETPKKSETPKLLSIRLAKEKGLKLSEKYPEKVILSADTVVAVGRRIIDKCNTKEEVIAAMKMLSGKNHTVFTAVCITNKGKQSFRSVETKIKFKRLTEKEIAFFAETGEGIGKAGGYSILGFAESFILKINGSVSSVIGLPSYETTNLLQANGITRSL